MSNPNTRAKKILKAMAVAAYIVAAAWGIICVAEKTYISWLSFKRGKPDWDCFLIGGLLGACAVLIIVFVRLSYRAALKLLDEREAVREEGGEAPRPGAAGAARLVEKSLFAAVAVMCAALCTSGLAQYVYVSKQGMYRHVLEVHKSCGTMAAPVFMAYVFFLIRRNCGIWLAVSAMVYFVASLTMYHSPAPNVFALVLSGVLLPGVMLVIALGRTPREDRARLCLAALAIHSLAFVLLSGFAAVNSPFRIRFSYSHRILHAFAAPCAVMIPVYCMYALRGSRRVVSLAWGRVYAALALLLVCVAAGGGMYMYKERGFEKVRAANVYPTKRLAAKTGEKFRPVPAGALGSESMCGVCHPIPYRQWARSVHALAAKTATFQKVVSSLTAQYGAEFGRDCATCHDPEAALAADPRMLTDPEHIRKSQGVGCRACHYMSVSGGKNELYALEIPRSDLITWSEKPGDFSSRPEGSPPAPGPGNDTARANYIATAVLEHIGDVTKTITKSGEVCYPCHRLESVRAGHVQIPIDNVSSYESSRFSKIMPCHRCHMPRTEIDEDCYAWMDHSIFGIQQELGRVLISHDGVEESDIAKFTEINGKWLMGKMPRLAISAQDLSETNSVVSGGGHIDMALESRATTGGTMRLKFSTLNRNAGHDFPTSLFANITDVWFELEVLDAGGRRVYFSGFDADDYTHRPGRVEVDARGRPIMPADSLKYVTIINRKFLRPGVKYFDEYTVPAAPDARYPLKVKYRLMYRRYSDEFARWYSDGAVKGFPARTIAEREFKVDGTAR